MSANPDSVANQGLFHSRVPPSHPITNSGHQLGQKVGHQGVPEFHAKTYPPGTAPKEHSFQPNPFSTVPGQALNEIMDPSLRTSATDTLRGASSADVYNDSAFARPMGGQTSRELRSNRNEKRGLEGRGATATTSDETVEGRARALGADLPEGVERGIRDKGPGAEDRQPASATEIASEKSRA